MAEHPKAPSGDGGAGGEQVRRDVSEMLLRIERGGGYESIHGLQRGSGGASLATEFRNHADGAPLAVDFAANARSLGCRTAEVSAPGELEAALAAARAAPEPAVVVCHVEPHRALIASGAFWDLGVAEVSQSAATRAAFEAQLRGRAAQRHYGWRGG